MKSLEEQVNDIKEKIFRTKARLLLLQETVVGGDIVSGARAVIIHKNEMGSTFLLTSATYALDGQPIFTKVDVNGDLSGKDQVEIFNGRIVPGTHQITVKLEYTGHGFGPISYLEGYKYQDDLELHLQRRGRKGHHHHRRWLREGRPLRRVQRQARGEVRERCGQGRRGQGHRRQARRQAC